MIVRITFLDENQQPFMMLFGDSYKKWRQQYQEYLWLKIQWRDKTTCTKRELFGIEQVEKAKEDWKLWDGLKWCSHKNFQHQLNREGCQGDDPDNSNSRRYDRMVFTENKRLRTEVRKMYKERLRHLA